MLSIQCAETAERLWRGVPRLWEHELQQYERYTAHIGHVMHVGDVELWFERVQAQECPVAGAGCGKPASGSRFCAFHRVKAPPGL